MPLLWWTELDFVSLKGSAVSSSVCLGVYGLDMALGSPLLMIRVVFLFCKSFGVKCPGLEFWGLRVGLGLSVDMEVLGELLSINGPLANMLFDAEISNP